VDANFGLEVGSAAVELISQGTFGVTVVSYQAGKIEYMDVADAIKQRFVSPEDVALYESLGTSFGREPVKGNIEAVKVSGRPTRVY